MLTTSDLAPFADIDEAKAQAMIDDVMALAARVAPCIVEDDFKYPDAAKAVLRRAVLRWNDAGSGVVTQEQQTAGSFSTGRSYDNKQTSKGTFWPADIAQLQDLCRDSNTERSAFSVDTAPGLGSIHSIWCSLGLGGDSCSCGANIAGFPIYEPEQ